MTTIIDLNAELAKLRMLHGRTPETSRAEREGSAARLALYRDGGIFASKSAGKGSGSAIPMATNSSKSSMVRRRCTL